VLSRIIAPDEGPPPARISSAEQSNSSILFGGRMIMKCFRRHEPGPNPDTEISRFLTERTGFRAIAPFGGAIEYARSGEEPSTLAMLQGFVANDGDGWKWTLDKLEAYYKYCAGRSDENAVRKFISDGYFEAARELGRVTADMHRALASSIDDPDFAPETMTQPDIEELSKDFAEHAAHAIEMLRANLGRLPEDALELGGMVAGRRRKIIGCFHRLTSVQSQLTRTRIHGDYHLGQVLRISEGFIVLDFEGEPARPLTERRKKQPPLKDVSGMLRSFSYAAWSGLAKYAVQSHTESQQIEQWAKLWIRMVSDEFLRAYLAEMSTTAVLPQSDLNLILDAYLLDKALYELSYELNNRPDWVRIPLMGIVSLLS
jgi:maltose alpha-D-glucosyltransferase/alpha-amylase